jgi:hypothetical protein
MSNPELPPADSSANFAWLEEGLETEAAAAFLKVSIDWLERKRCEGGGPTYNRLGPKKIVYTRRNLIKFRDSKEFQSTAQYQPAKGGDEVAGS